MINLDLAESGTHQLLNMVKFNFFKILILFYLIFFNEKVFVE